MGCVVVGDWYLYMRRRCADVTQVDASNLVP